MRKENQQSLKNVIDQVLKSNSKLSKGLLRMRILDAWKEVAGEMIQKKTLDVYYENAVLFVKLDSSTLRAELMHQKQVLVERINHVVERQVVKEIVFK